MVQQSTNVSCEIFDPPLYSGGFANREKPESGRLNAQFTRLDW